MNEKIWHMLEIASDVRAFMRNGYSVSVIASALELPESTIIAYKNAIESIEQITENI